MRSDATERRPDLRAAEVAGEIRQVFPADALAVRAALAALARALLAHLPSAEARGTVELVLAEVLNNIVEHAYRSGSGPIELRLRPGPDGVEVFVADEGRPFPGGVLPPARRPSAQAAARLPEGGFGWAMIRDLSRDLRYSREGGRNELRFRVPVRQFPDGN